MQVSKLFIDKVFEAKKSGMPLYKLAMAAQVYPPDLSKIIHHGTPLKVNDRRVLAIGKLLGLNPNECFSEDQE